MSNAPCPWMIRTPTADDSGLCGVVSDYPHESKCVDCGAPHAHPGTRECWETSACEVRILEQQNAELRRALVSCAVRLPPGDEARVAAQHLLGSDGL